MPGDGPERTGQVLTAVCNLYSMTATVDELRRMFGPFEGDTDNQSATRIDRLGTVDQHKPGEKPE